MGGWIALLLARQMPEHIAGIIGIAAAPDFTEDKMWAEFTDHQKSELLKAGSVAVPSDYSDEPYIITRKLIEDGRDNLVLRDPLRLDFPLYLLHGTADTDVAVSVPLRILDHVEAADASLLLIKDADHRFSSDENLDLITETLDRLLGRL